ncbi:hypothetical protein ACFSTC_49975 [Nonomuraea ferruginea]
MKLATDPSSALNDIKNAEAAYDRAFTDVMGELDRIRRSAGDLTPITTAARPPGQKAAVPPPGRSLERRYSATNP